MRGKSGVIDWARSTPARAISCDMLGIELDPHTPVSRLGVAMQQMTEIAKALVNDARVLILDEPTAAITAEETEQLFQLVEKLKAQGTGIILISHHLEDATRVGDRATVLRDGRYVDTVPMATSTPNDLIRLMVGRELTQQFPKEDIPIRRGRPEGRPARIAPASCTTSRSMFARARSSGWPVWSAPAAAKSRAPSSASTSSTAARSKSSGNRCRTRIPARPSPTASRFCRKTASIRDWCCSSRSATTSSMAAPSATGAPPGLLPPRNRVQTARRFIDALRIKTPSARQKVMFLSGGNQQKVVLAKWMLTQARIFIFDEPTRGIDVGAKVEVYRLMNELLKGGAAIVMISSELPEVLGMSDRILVMREGEIVAEFDRANATQESIMSYAAASTQR